MNSLPQSHKYAIAAAIIALLVYMAAHILLLRPAGDEVDRARAVVDQKQKILLQKSWPLDHERLKRLLNEQKQREHELSLRQDELIEKTTTAFDARIRPVYGSRTNFLAHVSRLDYQEEFYRIRQELQAQSVVLDAATLGLSENTVAPVTSHLVLRLWSIEQIVNAALTRNLQVAKAAAAGRNTEVMAVTSLPVTTMYSAAAASEPVMLKLSVSITVTGAAADLTAFLRDAGGDKGFISVNHLELFRLPEAPREDSGDQVRAILNCSMFFPVTENPAALLPSTQKLQRLPPGA